MAFIDTIAASRAAGEVRDMYQRQQAFWGYVPNYAKVFSHRPEVLARWGRLLAEIRRPMDDRRFELVTFAAAHALRNTACALAHGKALTAFFSAEQVLALAEHGDTGTLGPAERAMIGLARKVAIDAAAVDQGDVEALRGYGFSDAEIFDIVATAAGRAFFTKLLDGLGVLGDAAMLALDEAFRQGLSVGRPIDGDDAERLSDAAEPVLQA
ncbi:MAG: carboxymuconolactone decarboxylase family protein [Rhodocyclaceae bacterium]|nr:carboxymuconolactone decarboxylase family protein [Rhodocyclaceae bacterium]